MSALRIDLELADHIPYVSDLYFDPPRGTAAPVLAFRKIGFFVAEYNGVAVHSFLDGEPGRTLF